MSMSALFDLLRKAVQPVFGRPQPVPTVPVTKPQPAAAGVGSTHPEKFSVPSASEIPAPPDGRAAWSEHELKSHSKRHYPKRGPADDVVRRMFGQDPHMARNLRSYPCPICQHQGRKQYVVGRESLYGDKDITRSL